ncbi:hypothetical protein TOT_020000086 [Theileria orientalis strain Shintoku]|uniref:Uncharacterized protein n=1 Tax=Theileria orientalis strain Shintoku TaxID=869250 RepID=J4D6Y1_THEOR|nr:hypothetical protein TOT_020000086 [Theileria orientalis strain Shintoku]PVC50244.1 hypothetical protein MACL_00002434 [Theileria orientalis]BAM39815.1 hypothetical protein TOT_020000086 [Theileria orientalis strain Shintoku]|eukprot:XP_009690116.1 hypothetical protein TOT_020000086 [Theileria orientalis strain Shintoku]
MRQMMLERGSSYEEETRLGRTKRTIIIAGSIMTSLMSGLMIFAVLYNQFVGK